MQHVKLVYEKKGYFDYAKCSYRTLPADLSRQQEELKVPANNRGYQRNSAVFTSTAEVTHKSPVVLLEDHL